MRKDTIRMGRFYIRRDDVWYEPDKVAQVLRTLSFVPMSVSLDGARDAYKYIGISAAFEPMKWPSPTSEPEYGLSAEFHADGILRTLHITSRPMSVMFGSMPLQMTTGEIDFHGDRTEPTWVGILKQQLTSVVSTLAQASGDAVITYDNEVSRG